MNGTKVESKVIALLGRTFVQDRDLLDLFLFRDALPPDAGVRLEQKLATMSVTRDAVKARLGLLRENAIVCARGVDHVIAEQVDGPAAGNLLRAGGGSMICEAVLDRIEKLVGAA